MRDIHTTIQEEWCVHPPDAPSIQRCTGCDDPNLCGVSLPDHVLEHCFNWGDMSPYPQLNLPSDVREFRRLSITEFTSYVFQKGEVQEAWTRYNDKLTECSGLEFQLDEAVIQCDALQTTLNHDSCAQSTRITEARRTFSRRWDSVLREYNLAARPGVAPDWGNIRQLEFDRKREWETLRIVQCLLRHVYESVETSLTTGAPCPTEDSDPDGVRRAIEDCHIVTDSMTEHLTIDYGAIPSPPPLPPPLAPPCSQGYIAREQGSFDAAIAAAYTTSLLAADPIYPEDPLSQYFTAIPTDPTEYVWSWPGCSAPRVCEECNSFAPAHVDPERTEPSVPCLLHQEYLSHGSSDAETFRCGGGFCLSLTGRCNGHSQCGDGSDEEGCFDPDGTAAYLGRQFECPSDMNTDVYFQCRNNRCIERIGLCNGFDNCADGSDELQCSAVVREGASSLLQTQSAVETHAGFGINVPIVTQVKAEATSGRPVITETLQARSLVFPDRDYRFDSLGDFAGKTQLKYHNEDKLTDKDHVMMKIMVDEPMTVFIVLLSTKSLSWLDAQGYAPVSRTGVTYSGSKATRHTDWSGVLTVDDFDASQVWSRTFKAGTISIPGNDGGEGGFLVFLEPA